MTDTPSPAAPADKHAPSIDDVVALMAQDSAAPASGATDTPPKRDEAPADTPREEDSGTGEPSEADTTEADSPDDAETEPDADAEAEAEAEETGDPVYLVKIDGQEREVAVSELIKGYQLESVARRKMDQATAAERRAEERERQAQAENGRIVEAVRTYQERAQQYDAVLAQLQGAVDQEGAQWAKVEWDRLEQDDPVEYARTWARYQRHLEKKRSVESEQRRREQEQQAEHRQQEVQAQAHLRGELARMFPEWADDAVRQRDIKEMSEVARSYGYSEQELARWYRPQDWAVLRDAALYRRLKSAGRPAQPVPKPIGAKPAEPPKPIRMVRPDAPRPNPAKTARATLVNELQARALRTGNPDDVVALMVADEQSKNVRRFR